MATIDLRRLDSNSVGPLPVTNGSAITWGEVLTSFGSGQSFDQVLRDLYDQGLIKFTFADGTVAQDVNRNAYRSLSLDAYSTAQKGQVVDRIEVDGSSGADAIYGTEGGEVIRAGSGDDVITGGGGADVLTGGRGKDTFAYQRASDSAVGQQDVITDFRASEGDRIDLSALGRITWGGQAALGSGTASAWFTVSGSTTSLFVDTDGNGTADMRIDLQGVTSIAVSDLIGVSLPAAPPPPPPPAPPPAGANPDVAAISEDASSAQVSGNVLSNDAAGLGLKLATVNGQKILSKTTAIPGKHGTLSIDQDGRWTYSLNNGDAAVQALGAGESTTETFTYAATGKGGTTVTSTLTVTINGTNDAPVAAADTATTEEDAAVTIDVLRNDKDTDRNDKLTVTSAQVTTGLGVVSVNPDGTVKYDPAGAYDFLKAGDIRQVVITYQVSDGKGGTATSTATVTVMGKSVPVAPVAMDGSAAGDEDIAFSSSVQATDPDSTNLTYSVVDAPQAAQGTLDFKANGTYTFTPAPDFSGTVTFTYKASDGTLDSNVATVTLTVRPVDDAPVAADDVTTTNAGEAVTIDVLANDTDPDGGSKTVEAFTQALGGAVTKDADGNLVYTPYSGFSGQDSFTYTLNGGSVGTVTVNVQPVAEPEPPTVALGNATASEADGMIGIPVTFSHEATKPVTLTYEVTQPGKVLTFETIDRGSAPSGGFGSGLVPYNYEGLRWHNMLLSDLYNQASEGSVSVVAATEGGGSFSAIDPGQNFGLKSLLLSSSYANQMSGGQRVVITAYDNGVVKGTKEVVLTGNTPIEVTFDGTFADIDSIHVDGAENTGGGYSDAAVVIDRITFANGPSFTGSVEIEGGQTAGLITIPVPDDSVYSGDRVFNIRLTGAEGAVLGDAVEATGTVTDDDAHPLPRISIINFVEGRVEEGGLGVWFELTRDSRIDEDLTVQFESEVFGSFEVTFPAGSNRIENIELGLKDDSVDLGTRPYEIRIKESANYVPFGKTSLTGTAVDNDGNSPPEAYDLSFYTNEDTLAVEGFEFNGQGYDNQQWSLSYEIVEQPTDWGTVVLTDVDYGSGPVFKFVPHPGALEHLNDGQTEKITFRYVAKDGVGGVSAPATVTLNVSGVTDGRAVPTISIGDVTVSDGPSEDGGGQWAIVRITLSQASSQDIAVKYSTVEGTAKPYQDYSPSTWTAYIPAGKTEVEVAIPIWEDDEVEGDETFKVVLSDPVNATILKGEATVTITDGEQGGGGDPGNGTPGVKVTSLGYIQVEEGGNSDTLTVVLTSKPAADVTVPLYRDDYNITLSTYSLTFTPDNWDQPQTVTITAEDDADVEGDHTSMVFFGETSSTDPDYDGLWPNTMEEYVYITDNDEAGNTAPYATNVTANTWEDDLSVDVMAFGGDMETWVTYEIVNPPANATVTLLPDGTTFRVDVDPAAIAGLNRGQTLPVTFQYKAVDSEGLESAPATIRVNVHGITDGADETIEAKTTTTWSQKDTFAINGGDGIDTVVFNSVTLTSGSGLEISLGKTIKWTEYDGKPIVNVENITIRNTTGDTARTMTVGGDGQANVITIENTNHKLFVNGGGGNDTINFKGTGNGLDSVINGGAGDDTVNAYSAVTVDVGDGNDTVNVFNGSNVTVRNFSAGDKINFAAGIQAGNVSPVVQGGNTVFTISKDGVTSTVTVVDATALVAGTDWTSEGVIQPPPADPAVISAGAASGEVTEGGIATFTFSRTGDLSQPLTVAIDAGFGSAVPGVDFIAPTTITFAAGSDTAILEVQTIDNGVTEAPRTIEVRIVPSEGYAVGAADGNVTELVDSAGTDPDPVLPSLSINDVTVDENAGTATFTVTLSAVAATLVTVDYATALASGPAGSFTPTSGTLTFEPGETSRTIEVRINDNADVATGAQKFVVNLSNLTGGATLANIVGEGTIVDDDMPAEMPTLTIATTAGLDENSTISWNAIPGAASYVLIGVEPDEPNFPPHTLGFAVAPNTFFAIDGNDEFTGMVVHVEARDAQGNVIARSENRTDLIANVNDVPTGRPVISDNTPEVGQLLTISIGTLQDGDGMRPDRPDEFGYLWERSTDGVTWSLVGTTDSYQVTAADAGYFIRGAARYADRGDTLETVYSLVTAKVNDPNPNTPPVAFDDVAETLAGQAVTVDVLLNDFDFESDAISVTSHGHGKNGTVTLQDGKLVYTPNVGFVGIDTFEYTLNGGDTAKVIVTVTQEAEPLRLLTVDGLHENSILSWTAVPSAVSYVLIGLEPDDPTAPPHELGFVLAPITTFNINGDDEFVGMAIHVEARDASGNVITRSVNETGAIENINDVPTGNLSIDDMTPEVGQTLRLGYGTFEDGDGYRDRGREDEFQWAFERSFDGVTWTTIVTGASAGRDGPFGLSYTVTQADNEHFLRGRAIYEDRAGDTIETVYSLTTSRVGATLPGGGGDGSGGGDPVSFGEVLVAHTGGSTVVTEGTTTDTFTVVLADAPASDVTVQVSTGNELYTVGTSDLVFTPENWNVPQTVTVGAPDDFLTEGPHSDVVSFYTFSTDPRYDGLMPADLPVSIVDGAGEPDPISFVSIGGGGQVTEGGEITFNFMRTGGVNTDPLAIVLEMTGLDASDIAVIKWNGVEGGFAGFRAGAARATMTVVLADDAIVEGTRTLEVRVLPTADYLEDFDNIATATVLDNDVAPVNAKPVVESRTVDLTEDQMTAAIKPLVTDADGNLTAIKVVETLPTYVTFDEASQTFHFNGEASAFDHLNQGEKETITFQYVANDGTEDSDPGVITININGITDQAAPQRDVEPAPGADPYNHDLGNGGPAGQRTAGADILNGSAGQDTIQGFGGNDTIYGKEGNDSLVGGNGDDTIYGGSGDDHITGDGGGTNANNVGAPGADLLYGGDGNDTILGGDGNDTIVGGHGADDLTGGNGDDTFVYLSIHDRGDTVTMQGRLAAKDVFDFREFDFGPNEPGRQGPTGGFQLFNQAPVQGQMVEDAFYYDASTGGLSINTGQDGMEDFFITIRLGSGAFLARMNSDNFLI